MKTEFLQTTKWLLTWIRQWSTLGIIIIISLKVNWLENDLRELNKAVNTDVTNRLIELKFMIMEKQGFDMGQVYVYDNIIKELPASPPTIVQTVELGTPYTIIEGCEIVYFVENGKVVYFATPEELGMR